ncbi:MAG TPA: hypothetical protein VF127_04775 [Nitrospira sp.]
MNPQGDVSKSLGLSIGAFVVGVVVGCAGGSPQQDASYKLVPITEVGMVAGEWEGLVKKDHATLPEGSVRLMIRANSTYLFAGQTVSAAAVGSGDLEVRDGRLVGETEKRAVRLTLYDHKGKAVVFVESTNLATGERYRGEFTKVQ